ncbi:glycosyltransferase family 2 protein [Linnemannia elongata AG-77]|uniref:dolichyl-phosphate beta-glucosyltransferase n=1 Tax=Linnemannia elongata AG-77 TaxID=1314771 RepID=A0A197JNV8_9FUNG|nr:glycosyltransferase family 2 protein [Linnemannia elongata AG-77]
MSWTTILSAIALGGILCVFSILYMMSPHPREATPSERCYQDLTHLTSLIKEENDYQQRLTKQQSITPATPTPGASNKKTKKIAGGSTRSDKYKAQLKPLSRTDEGAPTKTLSVVVPAYNESERLPIMMKETLDFLKEKAHKDLTFSYEILIVDDGSQDSTVRVALEMAQKEDIKDIRVLSFEKNRGKGGAVIQGMQYTRGEYILMVDADGATRFSDLDALQVKLKATEQDGLGVAVGSRAHMVKTDAVVKRSFIRNFLMYSFHKVVYILGCRGIEDTQCGFKLFSRKAAQAIFPNMHVEGWVFDIEVLMIAQQLRIPIVEVPVAWQEIDGSKVSLMRDSIQMALDLLIIRMNYLSGIWRIRPLLKDEKAEVVEKKGKC